MNPWIPFLLSSVYLLLIFPMLVGHLFFFPLSTSYSSSPCLWGTFSSFLCLPLTCLPHACESPFLLSSVYLLLIFPMLVGHLFFFPLSTSYSSSPCLWGTFSSFLCLPLTCLPHACGAPFLVSSVLLFSLSTSSLPQKCPLPANLQATINLCNGTGTECSTMN